VDELPLDLDRTELRSGQSSEVLVVIAGHVDDARAVAAHRADVFVFASRTETQGLVIIESMALGTPVVSTDARSLLAGVDALCYERFGRARNSLKSISSGGFS
jgi:glycosyltransferase involved in cell wall biosynthesis